MTSPLPYPTWTNDASHPRPKLEYYTALFDNKYGGTERNGTSMVKRCHVKHGRFARTFNWWLLDSGRNNPRMKMSQT
jgi:hypothetical protein